jgi:hypothetical protein
MNTYNLEMTDTFGGEANYAWVRRYTIKARSFRGAISALSRKLGGHFKINSNYGDFARYDMIGAAICVFVYYADLEF